MEYVAILATHANYGATLQHKAVGSTLDDSKACLPGDRSLNGTLIQLAVSLGPWSPNCRPPGAIEKPELYARMICSAAHETVEGVNFPHQMAFPQSTDSWIAGHLANRISPVRHQGCSGPETRCSSGSFRSGVATTNYNDVETSLHVRLLYAY
jgi:hypothetical protein